MGKCRGFASKLCKGLPTPEDVILKSDRNPSQGILRQPLARITEDSCRGVLCNKEHIKDSVVEKHFFTLEFSCGNVCVGKDGEMHSSKNRDFSADKDKYAETKFSSQIKCCL